MNECVKTVCIISVFLAVIGLAGISYCSDSGFTHTFTVTSDWGSGFVAHVSITNQSGTTAEKWTVEFDFPYKINAVWNAHMKAHVGNRYTITNCSWNGTLSPGQSVSFGFQGVPGTVGARPGNVKIHQ